MVGSTESGNKGLGEGVECQLLSTRVRNVSQGGSHEQSQKRYRRVLADRVRFGLDTVGDRNSAWHLRPVADVPVRFAAQRVFPGLRSVCRSQMDYSRGLRRRRSEDRRIEMALLPGGMALACCPGRVHRRAGAAARHWQSRFFAGTRVPICLAARYNATPCAQCVACSKLTAYHSDFRGARFVRRRVRLAQLSAAPPVPAAAGLERSSHGIDLVFLALPYTRSWLCISLQSLFRPHRFFPSFNVFFSSFSFR